MKRRALDGRGASYGRLSSLDRIPCAAKFFKTRFPNRLPSADGVALGPVDRPQLLADDERLSPEAIAETLRKRGRAAKAFASADEIAEYFAANAKPGDLVMVMSNGSFGGLCGKLLDRLKSNSTALTNESNAHMR